MRTLLATGIYPSCEDPNFQKALENLLGEEQPEQAEGMDVTCDGLDDISIVDPILEMDDEALTKLLEEIKSDEQWEA